VPVGVRPFAAETMKREIRAKMGGGRNRERGRRAIGVRSRVSAALWVRAQPPVCGERKEAV